MVFGTFNAIFNEANIYKLLYKSILTYKNCSDVIGRGIKEYLFAQVSGVNKYLIATF